LSRYCCCAAAACRRAAWAVNCSLLFGEPEKNDVNLVVFENDVLRVLGLSDAGATTVEAGEPANGLGKPLRTIATIDGRRFLDAGVCKTDSCNWESEILCSRDIELRVAESRQSQLKR